MSKILLERLPQLGSEFPSRDTVVQTVPMIDNLETYLLFRLLIGHIAGQ